MDVLIQVVWYGDRPDVISRGYWDQGFLEEFFARHLWKPPGPTEFKHMAAGEADGRGAVVVVPARWHAGREAEVREFADGLAWCLLVLTGDEENAFDRSGWDPLGERTRVWVQTPRPDTAREGERYIGDMCPPEARQLGLMDWTKDRDWFFAGQINTLDRSELQMAMGESEHFTGTNTFGSGLPYAEYLSEMARSKVAPCPGGPFTPDTFRLFEALEAGCAPVVRDDPYWAVLGDPPLVKTADWRRGIKQALRDWPDSATRASCWYQRYKREIARRFYADLFELSGEPRPEARMTVLMPTSSAPADPSTEIIEETVSSLPSGVEVIMMMDGLHFRHQHRFAQYAEYRRRVAWLCEHRWTNVLPIFFEEHLHQAEMTRRALGEVHTPQILFVEHDTPLVGEVPWAQMSEVVASGEADVIRLHHEAHILPEHEHLMRGGVEEVAGVPMRRTAQWSQRPHLASAAFYRRVIAQHFTPASRTFIEDVVHSPAQDPACDWKLWIYHPPGDMKRSRHLDAREGEPKVPMVP